jgi:hypothetical protein
LGSQNTILMGLVLVWSVWYGVVFE